MTASAAVAAFGTLDWMFAEYRADRRYTKLDPKSKRNHEVGFKLVGGYVLKDGKRLGEKRLTAIDTALTDDLYEKLIILKTTVTARSPAATVLFSGTWTSFSLTCPRR